MLQLLLSQSPDIQKILAFEGAFEKLFTIITQEGGLEGGVTVRDALACVDALLRYNPSNQVALVVACCEWWSNAHHRATSVKLPSRQCCLLCFYFLRRCHRMNPHLRTLLFNSGTLPKNGQTQRTSLALWAFS